MRTIETTIHTFEDVKADKVLLAKVLEKNRYYNVQDSFWYEYSDESFKSILERIGFYDIELAFSLSYSQSDYANFKGNFAPRKDGIKEVIEDFVTWTELHNILNELQGHLTYLSNDISFTFDGNFIQNIESDEYPSTVQEMENDFCDICRKLCKLYYKSLSETFDYETSDEGLTEYFTNSDTEFCEDGSIYYE